MMNNLVDKIEKWGHDRMITVHGNPMSQAIKTLEETTELLDAINTGNTDMIKDAVGDIFVTLVMVCGTANVSLTECIELAYDEIKDRRGYLRADGTFMKL